MRSKHAVFAALVLAALMGVTVPPSRADVSFEGFYSDLGPHGAWLVQSREYRNGTWTLDPSLGWVWIPGYAWAPAWVEFRTGPDYVGWAPVAPGFSFGLSFGGYVAPSAPFLFVPTRDFAAPRIPPTIRESSHEQDHGPAVKNPNERRPNNERRTS